MGEPYQVMFQKEGTVLTVRPVGRLDAYAVPSFSEQLEQELDDITDVVLDFAQSDYLSSAGLRVLMITEQKMEERGGGMKVIHVSDMIREILGLTGFLDFVTLE